MPQQVQQPQQEVATTVTQALQVPRQVVLKTAEETTLPKTTPSIVAPPDVTTSEATTPPKISPPVMTPPDPPKRIFIEKKNAETTKNVAPKLVSNKKAKQKVCKFHFSNN